MALFSKILIFYVIGVNISFVIIWFISHEKTHIRLLSSIPGRNNLANESACGITFFSLLGAVVEWTRWLS